MIAVALTIGYLSFAVALAMNLWRLAIGPGIADRILALDTMAINVIAIVIMLGISFDTAIYFEASMLMAMVAFVSTVALAKFILRGDIIE